MGIDFGKGGFTMANILVADDEMKMRRLLKEYLILEGYSIYEASNGKIGRASCRERV